MPSQAKASATREPDSAANLDFYRTRDEFVRTYQPATPEEKLLVTQIMRAWQHLQDIYDLRARLTARNGLLGLFEEDFDKYKLLMRNLAEAERMWRYALQEFQRARRRRDPLAPPRAANLTAVPSVRPASAAPVHSEPQPSAPAQRSAAPPAGNFEKRLQI
jgi:hypothetical protein